MKSVSFRSRFGNAVRAFRGEDKAAEELSAKSIDWPRSPWSGVSGLFDGPGQYEENAWLHAAGYWGNVNSGQGHPALVFNSVLMGVVSWICAMASQAEVRIIDKESEEDSPDGEALLEFLSMAGGDPSTFVYGTMFAELIYGNAFWLIKEDNLMRPADLHFIHPWSIRPNQHTKTIPIPTMVKYWMIQKDKYLPEQILHIRNGVDIIEPRMGVPPPRQILSEILLDVSAGGYTSEVLDNLGYAANILIPELPVKPLDATKMAQEFARKFGPGQRGSTFVPSAPMKIENMKADVFQGADLRDIRNICEERVCSAYRIQPNVVGLGTGMEQTKMGNTMTAGVRLSWRAGVVPRIDFVRKQLKRQLFERFGLTEEKHDLVMESSAIAALQEDPLERGRRLSLAVGRQAWMTTNEARRVESLEKTGDAEHDKVPDLAQDNMPPGSAQPGGGGGAGGGQA